MLGYVAVWFRRSCLAVLLFAMTQAPAMAQDWQVTMASLWGDQYKRQFSAAAMDDQGVAYVGGAPFRPVAGVEELDFANGSGVGMILAIDTQLGEVLWVARMPSPVTDLTMAHDGALLALSGQAMSIDLSARRVRWQASGGKRILCDGAGGAWVFTGSSANHYDSQGQQQRSVAVKGRDFAVDNKGQRLFTCGHTSGNSKIKERNPVHVPWVRAYDFSGERLWQMWGFTPTQVDEVGDMADSHPQRLFFSPNGHLYMFGDSDGGNTAYRHSPHEPGGKLGDALKGTPFNQMWRAFRSVRVLFVCRIDPKNGDVLRGSFFYGMWYNEEANREEIGDSQALGLHVDKEDRVYLTGIMRAGLPFTPTAVHKQSAPVDRTGYWKNKVATDEAYLAIIDQDFTQLAFCSGFNQNGSPRAWSRGLAVAAGGQGAVVVGTVRPNSEFAAGDLNFLRAPLQSEWGGDQDGYIAVLHRGEVETDPLRHTQATITRLFPEASDERVAELLKAPVLTPLWQTLASAEDPLGQRLHQLLDRLGQQSLSRVLSYLDSNPYLTQQGLRVLSKAWAETPLAERADEELKALNDNPELREAIAVGRQKNSALEILTGLKEVDQAEEATLLDRAFARVNGRTLQRFQQAALALYQQWPEHAFTQEVLAVAASYAVPVTEKDQEMLQHYGELVQLRQRLKVPGGVQPHQDDQHFRRINERVIKDMKAVIKRMQKANRRHPFTRGAENIGAQFGIL